MARQRSKAKRTNRNNDDVNPVEPSMPNIVL